MKSGDIIHVNGRGDFTFRTAAQIRELAQERDRLYAAGSTEEGDAVKRLLMFTALLPREVSG